MDTSSHSLINSFPAASEEDWRKRVEIVLKGADFDKKLVSHTYDNLAIRPLYARKPEAGLVAGAIAGRPWRVMTRVDHPVADEAVKLAIADLEGGADAVTLVFAGARSARGYGLSCKTAADLDAALEGVRLDLIDIRLDAAPADTKSAHMMAALVKSRKLDPSQLRIDFGIDPVAAVHSGAGKTWDAAIKDATATVHFLTKQGFKGPFLSIDLRPYHEAGASEGQELAAALAQGVLYMRALEAEGLKLAVAREYLSFVIPLDADQFLGMAKVRALRKLWQRVELACGLEPKPILIHAETSWRMMTKRDSYVNILRATIATFAAGIGGADSVTVLPFTQALGLPEEQARRLARNTSVVLQEESNLWRITDPAAGAGGYEAITEELAATAWVLFQTIEREGGLVESLTTGLLQARIGETHKARLRAISTRKEPLTGTSEFANNTETPPNILAVEPVYGAPRASTIKQLISHRVSEPFEQLRDRSDAYLASTGKRPEVQLITMGPLVDHTMRLTFTRNFFEVGGFDVTVLPATSSQPFEGKRDGSVVCIVGSDSIYVESAAIIVRSLSASGLSVWLAGKPGELEAELVTAGIKRFVYAGCDVVVALGIAHDCFVQTPRSAPINTEVLQ
jgi:methylmalonyl-CoA mutase